MVTENYCLREKAVAQILSSQVNLKSTKLEVHLFVNEMKNLMHQGKLQIDEICTDAHQTIKSIMGKTYNS